MNTVELAGDGQEFNDHVMADSDLIGTVLCRCGYVSPVVKNDTNITLQTCCQKCRATVALVRPLRET